MLSQKEYYIQFCRYQKIIEKLENDIFDYRQKYKLKDKQQNHSYYLQICYRKYYKMRKRLFLLKKRRNDIIKDSIKNGKSIVDYHEKLCDKRLQKEESNRRKLLPLIK